MCPNCGCSHGEQIGARTRWGQDQIRLQCRHCGLAYWRPAVVVPVPVYAGEPIPLPRVKCPWCKAVDTVVVSTSKPIRRHKCRVCGRTFKTNENL